MNNTSIFLKFLLTMWDWNIESLTLRLIVHIKRQGLINSSYVFVSKK